MAATRRLSELLATVRPRVALPEPPFTVSLSGGADSATLSLLAVEASRDVVALHVDHGLKGSAIMREAAVAIARRLDMEIEVVAVTVAEGPSPEEQARDARYAVFDVHERPLLTAHTRDDNAETILINLIRGTGAAGLAGIPTRRPPNTTRPLLDVTRDETREIAVMADLPFRDDPMNEDPALTRNRVRHHILPLMREINPRVVEAISRAGITLRADHLYLEGLVGDFEPSSGVPVGLLDTLPRPLGDRLLGRMLGVAAVGITADRIERMRAAMSSDSGREELAAGRSVIRRGALLFVE